MRQFAAGCHTLHQDASAIGARFAESENTVAQTLRLPEVIRSIGDRRCLHTGHDNFFTVELIDRNARRNVVAGSVQI